MTDIFGSLQSLIWLLMVILIVAVVVWAVRIALAPRGRPVAAGRPTADRDERAGTGVVPGPKRSEFDALLRWPGVDCANGASTLIMV
jgi:hypothetical protein